jgi:hypothetical protein
METVQTGAVAGKVDGPIHGLLICPATNRFGKAKPVVFKLPALVGNSHSLTALSTATYLS